MLLLTLSMLETRSPVEKFLKGCVDIQNNEGEALSVIQMCILDDLLTAERLYEDGRIESPDVPLTTIQERYNLARYIVSRNAVSLSNRTIKDRNMKDGIRTGKGWIKSAKPIKDSTDNRLKAIVFTNKGRSLAQTLFSMKK